MASLRDEARPYLDDFRAAISWLAVWKTGRGQDYRITDIGLRMLTPRELFDAQGFPDDYIIDVDADGNQYPKSEQVARCGNAVCPPIPAALVRANLPELCVSQELRKGEKMA